MPNVNRGEVWQIDFGMTAKVRPALILGADFGNEDRAIVTVIYRTTSLRGSFFEIPMRVSGLENGGSTRSLFARCQSNASIQTCDFKRDTNGVD